MKFSLRLRIFALTILIWLDQTAAVSIWNGLFLFGIVAARPNPDETISSIVGRNAIAGRRWALIAEAMIDAIFARLTGETGHCRRHIEKGKMNG